MSQQAPDSEVTASDQIDFSIIEYLRGPGGAIIVNGSSTDQHAPMQQPIDAPLLKPHMEDIDVGGILQKHGETESVMQEETTVQGDRMSSMNDSRLIGKMAAAASGKTQKEGYKSKNRLAETFGKRDSDGDGGMVASRRPSEGGDALAVQRNGLANQNSTAVLNNSDELK